MDYSPHMQRKLKLAGALFGLALGVVLAWTIYLAPYAALRGIPINPASFNLDPITLACATVISVVGAGGGAFLVAHVWQRPGLGLLLGALATTLVRVSTGYLMARANLENQSVYISVILPFGLILGVLLSFLGGLLGSLAERLILGRALRLMGGSPAAAALGWLLVLAGGGALGYIGGGHSARTDEAIVAAQAVNHAVQIVAEQPTTSPEPPDFLIAQPALTALRELGPRIHQPYQIAFDQHDGYEITTDMRFQDGLAVRCVSRVARISRCFTRP